jgi:predicted O-methyltransferase YrrM
MLTAIVDRIAGAWKRRKKREAKRVRQAATEGVLAALGRARYTYDVSELARLTASLDSSDYYARRMLGADQYADRGLLLDSASEMCPRDGLVLEFGVAAGRSINRLADKLPDRTIHGFDAFKGLPETWRPIFKKGHFAQAIPEVRANVRLHVGWFEETLPGFVAEHGSQSIALLHVDCDLYSSTKSIFAHLGGMIREGTIVVFDEYFNYAGWREHEFKAFQEFVAERRIAYRYRAVVPSHYQVAIEITSHPAAAGAPEKAGALSRTQ